MAGYLAEAADTIIDQDSLLLWMHFFNNPTGDYRVAATYLTNGEYEMSRNTLDFMLQKYDFSEKELMDYENVRLIYDALAEAQGDELAQNVLFQLEDMADSKEGESCYLARKVLSADYGYFYWPIITALAEQRAAYYQKTGDGGYTGPKMLVSPNPADYNVYFDWSAFETTGREIIIEVTNQVGGLIELLHPESGTTGTDWTTEKVTGSTCYYRLLLDGQEAYGGQIVINK